MLFAKIHPLVDDIKLALLSWCNLGAKKQAGSPQDEIISRKNLQKEEKGKRVNFFLLF